MNPDAYYYGKGHTKGEKRVLLPYISIASQGTCSRQGLVRIEGQQHQRGLDSSLQDQEPR
jgi:hypothetical protein